MSRLIPESDRICLHEAKRLVETHPAKYAATVALFTLLLCASPKLGRAGVTSAVFLRHIDDILDGDLTGVEDPEGYVLDIRDQIASRDFRNNPPISRVAQQAIAQINRLKRADTIAPEDLFLPAIDVMLQDFRRSRDGTLMDADALRGHHVEANIITYRTISLATGVDLVEDRVAPLAYTEGLVGSVNDFHTDWSRGLFNIPSSVMEQSGLSVDMHPHHVLHHLQVAQWFNSELRVCQRQLPKVLAYIKSMPSFQARVICGLLARGAGPMITKALHTVS